MTNREDLMGAIFERYGAGATHVESVPVKEVFQGKTVWDGIVEVFDLVGHPKTHRAYAWSYIAGDYGKRPRHGAAHFTCHIATDCGTARNLAGVQKRWQSVSGQSKPGDQERYPSALICGSFVCNCAFCSA